MKENGRVAKAAVRRTRTAFCTLVMLGGLTAGAAHAQTSSPWCFALDSNSQTVEPGAPASREREAILADLRENLAKMQSTHSADLDFATLMHAYNDALKKMAQDEQTHGQDSKIKLLAKKMLSAESKHQQELDSWIERFRKYD